MCRAPLPFPRREQGYLRPTSAPREDEYSIVTEGDNGFRCGDRDAMLADAVGTSPSHAGKCTQMWNAGDVPARMIEIISPAGFENPQTPKLVAVGPPAPPNSGSGPALSSANHLRAASEPDHAAAHESDASLADVIRRGCWGRWSDSEEARRTIGELIGLLRRERPPRRLAEADR